MMEKHEAHLVEERSRWSERRKMRSARRPFGFGLPKYLCRVYMYNYVYVCMYVCILVYRIPHLVLVLIVCNHKD